jgi:hypothetical protein
MYCAKYANRLTLSANVGAISTYLAYDNMTPQPQYLFPLQ